MNHITKYNSPNYDYGNDPKYIVIHHWGVDGQSFSGVLGWLCNRRSGVSAHYVVCGNDAACIVDWNKAAWHAGNYWYNHHSIGIECRPEMDSTTYRTVIELVAYIYKEYGRVLPVIGHKDIVSTACPGRYYPHLSDIQAQATALFKNGTKPAVKSVPTKQNLTVDGELGSLTVRKMQAWLGTPIDGIVSNQRTWLLEYIPAIWGNTWQCSRWGNSVMVKALQRKLGITADGLWGYDTSRAFQRFLGVCQDGYFGENSTKALQKYLNNI